MTFTPTDTADYNPATGSVSVTVNKATPTIATEPTASAISYGQALSLSTLTGGAATSNGNPVLGSFAFTTPGTTPGAGSPSESVTFTPTDTTDYNTASGSVIVTVSKATPTIATEPTASAITYGQALSSSTLTGGAATFGGNPVVGSFAFTTPATTPGAGTPSESVTFTPTDTTDYNTASGSVSVTVNKATPTIATEPTASAITYGQALSLSTLTGGAATFGGNPVAGGFAFTTPATTPGAGTPSESVTFTPTDTADYNTASGSVIVTVNKATPTIATEPTASAISYGQALSLSTLTGGAATFGGNPVVGSFAFTTPATTPGAGTPSESVTFTPTDTTDYNTASGSVSVTVNKATPTIATEPTASAITYGQALSLSTLTGGAATFGGNPVAGSFAFTTPTATPGAGTPSESVTFTPTDTTDYNTASGSVSVTVNKATPTIATEPTDSAITYGQALSLSTLTGGTATFGGNPVVGGFAFTTPTATPGAGTPSESVTFTPTDTTDYNTASGSVIVTVNQATPTLTWATPAAITYGTALSGTQLDAASGGVAGSFVYAPALGTVLGVGVQTLKATFTPTDTTDYTTGTAQVSLTVNKASSTTGEALTAGTNPSSYGASLTFTATVTTGATGSVSFYLEAGAASCSSLGASTQIGSTQTLSGGSAAVTTSTLAVGSDTVLACYSGDSNYNSSGGAVVQLVTETTTTAVAPTPVSIALGSSTVTQSLTATVSAASGIPAGTVTFEVGGVMVGTAPLSGGTAMWNGIAPTTANGFAVGSDTVTAIYTPATGSGFITSTGTQILTVTAPAYTITLSPAAISLDRGASEPVVLTLSSTTFADTTQWTATTSSPEITVIPSSGTATLTANGVSTANLTIMASDTAANHAPRLPWSGGLIAFGALLAGIPLAGRRKRVAAVLLTALAVSMLAFMMACGSARAHTYTVTFTGTGGISSTYTVTVQ